MEVKFDVRKLPYYPAELRAKIEELKEYQPISSIRSNIL